MPKHQHHKTDGKTYNAGANRDFDREFLGGMNEGEYLDAKNMRPVDSNGNTLALTKIDGDAALYPLTQNACDPVAQIAFPSLPTQDYECQGIIEVNEDIIDIWVSDNVEETAPPVIRINGTVVAMHEDLPFRKGTPIQYHKNESCVGGEIYLTDNRTPPLLFNVLDLKQNGGLTDPVVCTNKYFGAFDINAYTTNVNAPSNKPYFVGLFVGGGLGMKTGEYQYATRYVTADGDRTEWSPYTPPIPVPASSVLIDEFSNVPLTPAPNGAGGGDVYPYSKTFGHDPNFDTGKCVKLRIRVDNKLSFEYLQIKRQDYTLGQSFMPPSNSVIVAEIPIAPNQCDVIEWSDPVDALGYSIEIDEEDDVGLSTVIAKAKTCRYFNNRLFLMNIEEVSKDQSGNVTYTDSTLGAELTPVVKKLGKIGQADPYNHTYYKPFMSGDRYGFAVVFYDSTNSPSFATPITGSNTIDTWAYDEANPGTYLNEYNNYLMPNRRDIMTSAVQSICYNGFCKAANRHGSIGGTYEVFDHTDGVAKTEARQFINISNQRWVLLFESPYYLFGAQITPWYGCSGISRYRANGTGWWGLTAAGNNYGTHNYDHIPNGEEWDSPGVTTLCLATLFNYVHPRRVGYRPLHPVDISDYQTESSRSGPGGHMGRAANDYVINTRVNIASSGVQAGLSSANWYTYKPEGFGFNYYMLGVALDGINTSSLPSYITGFSIVRTKPAGRVLCQGLGYYSLISSSGSATNFGTQKRHDQIWFYGPDCDTGYGLGVMLDPNTGDPSGGIMLNVIDSVNTLGVNSPYKVQIISPVGFFTEVYSFLREGLSHDYKLDMITYCSILQDSGQINVQENSYMGISSGGDDNYVAFGKWRQQASMLSDFKQSSTKGNTYNSTTFSDLTIYTIEEIWEVNTGRQNYYKIRFDRDIYKTRYMGGNAIDNERGFNDANCENWHEPMYVCNIIIDGAYVPQNTVQEYYHTSAHINLRSVVARITADSTTTEKENVETSDERVEDFSPYPGQSGAASVDRFVWVNNNAWINVTYKTNTDISTIISNLTAQGYHMSGSTAVYGLFYHSSENGTDEGRNYTLHFKQQPSYSSLPDDFCKLKEGDVVEIKYDNSAPIRAFGGDSNTGESIWAPMDMQGVSRDDRDMVNGRCHWWDDGNDTNGTAQCAENEFSMDCGFPYKFWDLNPRIMQFQHLPYGLNYFQDDQDFSFHKSTRIRQLCAKFTVESRINTNFMYSEPCDVNNTDQMFPQVNYIYRPLAWRGSTWGSGNRLWQGYKDDYPDEEAIWGMGGFRFRPKINMDYSAYALANVDFGKPAVGFNEEVLFCSRVLWSEKRDVNQQDAPGVRTFPAANYFDVSDDTGEIKVAWDALSDKGSNLYAFTDSGVCLLVTDKRTLSSVEGADFTSMSIEEGNVVTDQFWISKTIGMNDQWWRSYAEYNNVIYFANKKSVYHFSNNKLTDIGKIKYYSKIVPFVEQAGSGYSTRISAVYDDEKQEYILGVATDSDGLSMYSLVWSEQTEHWIGEFSYNYHKYLSYNNNLYGAGRWDGTNNPSLWKLNDTTSVTLRGVTQLCFVQQVSAPDQNFGKEFFRFRVNSNSIPSSFDVLDPDQYPTVVPIAQVLSTDMKTYDGFEQYIPRNTFNTNRIQGRLLIYQINCTFAEVKFSIISSTIEYKTLK
tara:strand:+ start:3292 stop:8298 length:5007 start_codon:yes stop_codon:yes gene_type:complete